MTSTEHKEDPCLKSFTTAVATTTTKIRNSTKKHLPASAIDSSTQRDVVGLKMAATRLDCSGRPTRREFLEAASQWRISSPSNTKDGPILNNVPQKQAVAIEELEEEVREVQIRNPFALMVLGFYAASKVMIWYLINLETILSCALTIGLTVYWYDYGTTHDGWNGASMDYVILAFAVTSPIAAAIGMAFTRREAALRIISDFRSFASQLYTAHSLWDWAENGGRQNSDMDLRAHSDAVLAQIIGIGDEVARFLTLPTTSRSIHRMTHIGRRQAAGTVEVAYLLLESMSHRITRLCVYGERIKAAGLPSSELSRIRQYERFVEVCIERLRMIKMYRTPQAFRSFARIFTFVLPPFYAPTYAQVGIDLQSLGMGIAFGIITALGLTALFECLQVLEDPFIGFLALDGIDVREEFQVLLWSSLVGKRSDIFPDAPPYPVRRRQALTEGIHFVDKGGARKHSKEYPSSPPSVLAFGTQHHRRSDHISEHSQVSSSLTDAAGTTSKPGTLHGIAQEHEIADDESTAIAEAIEFGGLIDEGESRHNRANSGDSTGGSYVRESNYKLHAPPTRNTKSSRPMDTGLQIIMSPSKPQHRRNQSTP